MLISRQCQPCKSYGDTADAVTRSPFFLCEDDRIIGQPHATHDDIRRLGEGRFSHWGDTVYFSSSDNTDPNSNGRTYRLVRATPVREEQAIPVGANSPAHLQSHAELPSPQCSDQHKVDHDHVVVRGRAHAVHAHDEIKADEHAAFLNLVPECGVTHVAIQSGLWSDSNVWRDGSRPDADARVLIPIGTAVQVDDDYDASSLDWVRVDGVLSFHPDRNTALAVRTLVVTEQGHLEIGTDISPIRRDVKARLIFAPRVSRDRRADPFDLAGGLISHGTVTMVAQHKTSHRPVPLNPRFKASRLDFMEAPKGWTVGDRILVPGTDPWSDQDELRTISAIHDEGRSIELDIPLKFDHNAPHGVSIWIGNLTRSIEVRSLTAQPLTARGHVMIMHVQTGTVLDGVAFIDLGRTDTKVGHTIPEIGSAGLTKPGSDINTIGRYAVHFHMRSGARTNVPPHLVRNSVVIDSPKYAIVNHGAHLLAEDNITFRVAGSHLVAENGSEVGAFRRNMAVRSSGSTDVSGLSRMGIYDNAHGGNGIWLVSGGVEVSDNWASGHATSGLNMLGMQFFEQGKEVFFDGRNIGVPLYADSLGRVALGDVNLFVRRNIFVASQTGIELWNHKQMSSHDGMSIIEDVTIWNVQSRAIFSSLYKKHNYSEPSCIWVTWSRYRRRRWQSCNCEYYD